MAPFSKPNMGKRGTLSTKESLRNLVSLRPNQSPQALSLNPNPLSPKLKLPPLVLKLIAGMVRALRFKV